MGATLAELLEGIIDYAGLFPPAKLSMDDSVAEYLDYRSGEESWIVNRFLCPAGRLSELGRVLNGIPNETLLLGVIGSGGADIDAFETGLEADARAMTTFGQDLGERAEIEAYETRRPDGDLAVVLSDLRAFEQADVFLELPWDERQADDLAAIAEAEWLGAKARTGGSDVADFPTSGQLARFLKGCQDLDVPFKLTAGLHAPIRHHDRKLGAWHHGFLNVLAALALNDEHDLSSGEMAEVLDLEGPLWTGSAFRWNEMEAAGTDAVRDLFVGFGSCSVEEPLEGLAKLGLSMEDGN